MEPIDDKDRAILALAQGDLPITERPFDSWAAQLGLEVHELLDRLEKLRQKGVVRAMKAVLRHKSAGFASGAMVAWAVPEDKIEEIGNRIAENKRVTHCYERPAFGVYTIFSMIHGRNDDEVSNIIEEIAASAGISEYKVFRSVRELKKTSMKYF